MARLGIANKIIYSSKDHVTGLENITAKVIKPNGLVMGPFNLSEITEPGFEGNYFFNFSTSLSDPEGDYFGTIFSADENHRTNFKVSVYASESGGGSGPVSTDSEEPLIGIIEDITISGSICDDDDFVLGNITDSNLSGEMGDDSLVSGNVDSNTLNGSVEDC